MSVKTIPLFGLFLYITTIAAEQCLPGTYHKKTSSPGSGNFAVCNAWREDACCTERLIEILNNTRTTKIYPFKSARCKNISKIYGSGKELCNKMWGTSFRYVDPSCPSTRLDDPIPAKVDEKSTCSGCSRLTLFSVVYLLILIALNLCYN